jgi:hypothetical protein
MDLVGNDVDTLHEERIHLVGFSFIRVYDKLEKQRHFSHNIFFLNQPNHFKLMKKIVMQFGTFGSLILQWNQTNLFSSLEF